MMKKLLLGSLLASSVLLADVTTVLPYIGQINYDNLQGKSLKDSAQFEGIYTSIGNMDYLVEFAYNYIDISYKEDLNIDDLKQHDLTLVYSKYYTKYMFKAGVHYINNNEKEDFRDLGDGFIIIGGLAGYTWFDKDKFTYGADVYYSTYGDAHNDRTILQTTSVSTWQMTPYLTYSKVFSNTTKNDITLKANMIFANDYQDSNYYSFEISDTLSYNNFYTILSYLGGNMKSGVRNAGFTVFNTKDLYKNSFDAKIGYYATPNLSFSLNYMINSYEEYNAATLQLLPEGRSDVTYLSASYSF